MQPRGPSTPAGEPGPLDEETHARVLDHQPSGMIQGISEKGLYLVRMRAPVDGNSHVPGTSIELESVNVLGTTRHRDLSVMSQAELQGVVKTILCDNPEVCLSFYNRAGNLTLKMHAFQLLDGIGKSKAISMVEIRGRTGWETIASLDEACQIDAADLLANRLCQEIADPHMTPNLLDLLIRA
jgi:predicted nucleic acid-binding OB-fold protein